MTCLTNSVKEIKKVAANMPNDPDLQDLRLSRYH